MTSATPVLQILPRRDPLLPAWLAAQPPHVRTAFLLKTHAGLDYAAIGARLGCDRTEVIRLLRTARDAGCTYRPWESPLPPPPSRRPQRPALARSLLQVWWVLPTGALLLVSGWLWLLFVQALSAAGLREAVVSLVLQGGAW